MEIDNNRRVRITIADVKETYLYDHATGYLAAIHRDGNGPWLSVQCENFQGEYDHHLNAMADSEQGEELSNAEVVAYYLGKIGLAGCTTLARGEHDVIERIRDFACEIDEIAMTRWLTHEEGLRSRLDACLVEAVKDLVDRKG
jgi:hypothetical protein